MEHIWEYWRQKSQIYEQRSDEGADTDSQDKCDHGMWPPDKKCHHILQEALLCELWG